MFRTLMKRMRGGRDRDQLALDLDAVPTNGDELLARLRELGLPLRFSELRLTRNRTVMVSYSASELRVHEGYLTAPRHVHAAIVTFVAGRTRAERRAAREAVLAHPVERTVATARVSRGRPEDAWLVEHLQDWHRRYNIHHFDGKLGAVNIRVSRRMQSRLGHYTAAMPRGQRAEIAISYAHIQKHGWEEALHTLLHEMVHQWQDEQGHAIDHGSTFRQKAREVGITASARRTVRSRRKRGIPAAPGTSLGLRAARGA
jgi:hypothetical protein